ncbi:MAG: sigma-54-dependent Fis family transcriptional regulator [Halobacteriovoraceae bacterium]|jgi:Nif-specific regulatory protein|nr:sigma-54-dependent Fis family transcriptional regulator [Halobacteriovoraceae bacterium]
MKSTLDMNKVSTLSTQLLSNLDEEVFFGRLSLFVQELFGEYKVQVYESFSDDTTILIAENGEIIVERQEYTKGQGLSGYVVKTKRAYYSNSKRDPLLATTKRDDCVESELCVPITCNGSVLGTIHVQSTDAERKFSEEDVEKVLDLLNNLNSPIRNMRLYLIAKNLNRELENKIRQKEEELLHRGPSISPNIRHEKVELIGHSKRFVEIMNIAEKVANEDFPILIAGETGTGKKLLAKKIHGLSARANAECIIVHCNSINETQLELELFGTRERPGAIQRANCGTLILDSLEELSEGVQNRLLRFIVSGELYTLDSNLPIPVNVRLISISKQDLKLRVEEGQFREELMYRLNIMNIKVPSLRDRKDDIKILSENFINNAKADNNKVLTSKAIERLSNYNWPGNIQELRNLMERTALLVSEQFIDESHLPELEVEIAAAVEIIEEFTEMTLYDLEKMHICKTLDHLGGNKTRAAKCLGITVKTLYNKLHSYGLVNPKSE